MGDAVSVMGGTVPVCQPLENCDDKGARCKRRFLQEDGEATLRPDGLDGLQRPVAVTEEPVIPTKLEKRQQLTLDKPNDLEQREESAGTDVWQLDGVCRPLVRSDVFGAEDAEKLGSVVLSQQTVSLPRGPQRHAVPTYTTTERSELAGEIRTGEVVQLRLGEKIQKVRLTIFVNGFCVAPVPGSSQEPFTRAWSPFTLIETCQVQVKRMENAWAVFKLTILRRKDADMFYYFGCSGEEADDERNRWVKDISQAIARVTLSLIPAHSIAVRPVPGQPGTVSRLMAGYLMLLVDLEVVALYYCELQAYSGGSAKLAMYQDEWCEHEVGSLPIVNTSVVSTRKGEYCTVLGVDSSLLCARTWKEKELWLRAVSNVKVKLMYEAPDPTVQELVVYRNAVLERVVEVEPNGGPDSSQGEENLSDDQPLLAPVRAKPPRPSPRGDVWHPEPMESPMQTPRDMGEVDFERLSRVAAVHFPAVGQQSATTADCSVPIPDAEDQASAMSQSSTSRFKQRCALPLEHTPSKKPEAPCIPSLNSRLKNYEASPDEATPEEAAASPNGHGYTEVHPHHNVAMTKPSAEVQDPTDRPQLLEFIQRERSFPMQSRMPRFPDSDDLMGPPQA